jgi:ABC-type antimicrobial peptide transport system permease subunit
MARIASAGDPRTLVAVLAGIGAAIMPARRASRLNVLDALHYE